MINAIGRRDHFVDFTIVGVELSSLATSTTHFLKDEVIPGFRAEGWSVDVALAKWLDMSEPGDMYYFENGPVQVWIFHRIPK